MALVNGIATGLEERVAMDRWLLLFDNAREKGRVGEGKFAPKVTLGVGQSRDAPRESWRDPSTSSQGHLPDLGFPRLAKSARRGASQTFLCGPDFPAWK